MIVRRIRSICVAEASNSTATRFPDQITSLGTDFQAPIVSPRGVRRNRSSVVTSFAAASVWSLPADVAPTRDHVGSIGGIQNFASNLAGVCIASFVGTMLEKTGGFAVPLVVAGSFSLLGAFSYLFIVPEIRPIEIRD